MFLKRKKYTDVLYEWLYDKNIKISSYNKYLIIIKRIIVPNIGNIYFKKLKVNDIYNLFNNDNVINLKDSTKNTILIIIKSSIKYGVQKKYRRLFYNIDIKFKKSKNEITYFTIKEQQIIQNYIINNMNIRNLMILVDLYTGIRIGELCSLKGSDIDFINNTISINKTVQRLSNKNGNTKTILIIDKPKTINSNRIIPVPEFIIKLLKKYNYDNNNYIFTNSNKPKDPRTVEKYFSNLLDKLNIKNLNFHSLRHSYATRLREQKVDIKVISELLGHSDWKITQDIYIHTSLDSKINSVRGLNNLTTKGS